MELLAYLVDLGVNAVELLPMSEFSGNLSWGYGDTHHFVIESSAGGRDQLQALRAGVPPARHRRDPGRRLQPLRQQRRPGRVGSTTPTAPEDRTSTTGTRASRADYPHPEGGYLDNGSSGWTPRFWEEPVRQLFISSAAEFVEEFHVDGLRVDLTQAIHRDNSLHAERLQRRPAPTCSGRSSCGSGAGRCG